MLRWTPLLLVVAMGRRPSLFSLPQARFLKPPHPCIYYFPHLATPQPNFPNLSSPPPLFSARCPPFPPIFPHRCMCRPCLGVCGCLRVHSDGGLSLLLHPARTGLHQLKGVFLERCAGRIAAILWGQAGVSSKIRRGGGPVHSSMLMDYLQCRLGVFLRFGWHATALAVICLLGMGRLKRKHKPHFSYFWQPSPVRCWGTWRPECCDITALHLSRSPEFYILWHTPKPWTAEDVLVVFRLFQWQVASANDAELLRWQMFAGAVVC